MTNPVDPKNLPYVPFGEYRTLPAIAGIYLVWQGETLLYLGKAGNIRRRWESHHRHSQMRDLQADRIAWMPYADLLTLDEMERELIDQLEPVLNRQPFTPPVERDEVVSVRLKTSELESIKAAADAIGLKVSQYLRMQGLRAAREQE